MLIKTAFTNNYVITLMKNLIKVSRLDIIRFLNFTQQAPDGSVVPAVLFPRVVWPVKVTFTHESAKDWICTSRGLSTFSWNAEMREYVNCTVC